MSKKLHAKFGSPSGLYALKECPGKIAFGRDIPEPEESEYAIKGTVFHSYIEKILDKWLKKESSTALIRQAVKEYPEFDEMIDKALKGFEAIYNKFRETHAGVKIKLEVPVKINDDIFGTSDVVMWGTNIKTQKTDVVTKDWKTGAGVKVEAPENLQGLGYLIGAIKTLKLENIGKCAIVIAQVGLEDEWSKWVFDGAELPNWEKEIVDIVGKAKAIYDGKAPLVLHAGSHCRFCKCIDVCPEQKKEHYDLVTSSMEELPLEDTIKKLTLDEQVKIFLKKSLIEDFLDAVAKNLNAAMQAGVTHPDIKMIKTAGRRSWKDEKKVVPALKKLGIKKPVVVTEKLIGIGEAEKIVGKGKLDKLTKLSDGNFEVVRADDKRQAIKFDEIEDLTTLE